MYDKQNKTYKCAISHPVSTLDQYQPAKAKSLGMILEPLVGTGCASAVKIAMYYSLCIER